MVVSLTYSGTAVNGTDYTGPTSITVPAGSLSASAATTVTAIQDTDPEGNETIIIDISLVQKGFENGEQQQTITLVDDDAPTITSVAVPANAIYRAAQNLDFTVTFNQPVTIDTSLGTPSISVTIGSTVVNAVLNGTVTGSATAVFRYTVQTGDEDTNGIAVGSAISLNGATIRNATALDAITTLSSVGSTANVKVDAIVPNAPVVTGVSTDTNIAGDGVTSDNTLLISGTSEANASINVFIGAVTIGTVVADGFGNWQFDYTATVLADGNCSITATATDAAGNTSVTSAVYPVTIDTAQPGVVITGNMNSPANSAFIATFTFDQEVYNFSIGDIVVGNGAASNLIATSASVYTATITPISNGLVTVDVAAGVANDLAGNTTTAAVQYSLTYDTVKPAVAISSLVSSLANSSFVVTFTFSEAVSGFTVDDITVGNGSAGSFTAVTASVYTALITPQSDGLVTVDVNVDVAQDAAGNTNTAAARYQLTFDATSPGVVISSSDINHLGKSFKTQFSFSEPVSGFTASDITVSAGTVNNFIAVSSTLYSALIKDAFASSVQVDVAAGVAVDAAGNTNTTGALTVEFDEIPPTVYCNDTVLYISSLGNAVVTAEEINNGSHDHFGIANLKINKSTFTCDNLGNNTVVLTVTDNSGNISTCEAVVTVIDTMTVKTKDITVTLDATGKAVITPDQIDNGSFSACGIVSYQLDKTEFNCSNYGVNTVTLTVTGRGGNTRSGTALVTVESINRAPVFDLLSDVDVSEDSVPFTLQINGIVNGDCEGVTQQVETITVTTTGNVIEKAEIVYTAGQQSAALTLSLKKDVSGEAVVTITARDNGGTANGGVDSYSSSFKVTVQPVNDAPVLMGSINPQMIEAGKSFSYTLPNGLFTDADAGDDLSYTVSAVTGSLPSWLSYAPSTLSFSGTPGASNLGNFFVRITATDQAGASASAIMEVIVYNPANSSIIGDLFQKSELMKGGAAVALYRKVSGTPKETYELVTRTMVSTLGIFGFYNLSAGDYIVEAAVVDEAKYDNLMVTYYDKSANWAGAKIISLASGTSQHIDMVMLEKPVQEEGSYQISGFIVEKTGNSTKSGLIEMSVAAESGNPLAGVTVQLVQNGNVVATCITDENGQYAFKNLPKGVYQIVVMLPGFAQTEVVAVEMKDENAKEENVNFTVWTGSQEITDVEVVKRLVEVKVFPNPTDGRISIAIANRGAVSSDVRIYSVTGQLVFEQKGIQNDNVTIDLTGNDPGVYLVNVSTGQNQQTKRLVLK